MKTSGLFISLALLFWGWQTGLLPLALLMALLPALRRLTAARWNFSLVEWRHIGDLCIILLLAVMVSGFLHDKTRLIYITGKFMPLITFPLIAARLFSADGKIPLAACFTTARRKPRAARPRPAAATDLSGTWCLMVLLAAGIGTPGGATYYPGVCLLIGGLLYPFRARRLPPFIWGALIFAAAVLGFGGQSVLTRLQSELLDFTRRLGSEADSLRTTTAIGDIRNQKMHNTILLRLKAESRIPSPLLLREACFNTYRQPSWHAFNTPLVRTEASSGGKFLQLAPSLPDIEPLAIRIQARLKKDTVVLPLPAGTLRIEDLPEAIWQTNALGTVVLSETQSKWLNCRVMFPTPQPAEAPPDLLDLDIPGPEQPVIRRIAASLQLDGCVPDEAAARIAAWFERDFGYTLQHRGKGSRTTPLEYFLLDRKAGHCELFATATALLLRSAGIPARYATGYAVSEYSPLEQGYIVRQRHAHAWVRFYSQGRWHDLDTTTAGWTRIEDSAQSSFSKITDVFSWMRFQISRLRSEEQNRLEQLAVALLLLLITLLTLRLIRHRKSARATRSIQKKTPGKKRSRGKSELEMLEKLLARRGYPRDPAEPLGDWALRIKQTYPGETLNRLDELIRQYYRHRFSSALPDSVGQQNLHRAINRLIREIKSGKNNR